MCDARINTNYQIAGHDECRHFAEIGGVSAGIFNWGVICAVLKANYVFLLRLEAI